MSKKMPVNDIMAKIQAIANENGVKLSYTNKMVYLKMIEYAENNSIVDYSVWTRIEVTTVSLSEICQVSKTIITETLHKLEKCGIIKYKRRHPNSSVLTLYKKYYQKENL